MISQMDFITRSRFDAAGYLRLAEQVDDLAERCEFERLSAKCLQLAQGDRGDLQQSGRAPDLVS
jgi:hypothetical protein